MQKYQSSESNIISTFKVLSLELCHSLLQRLPLLYSFFPWALQLQGKLELPIVFFKFFPWIVHLSGYLINDFVLFFGLAFMMGLLRILLETSYAILSLLICSLFKGNLDRSTLGAPKDFYETEGTWIISRYTPILDVQDILIPSLPAFFRSINNISIYVKLFMRIGHFYINT